MGNAALRDLAVVEPVAFDEIQGFLLAIDAHNWLYRYLTTTVRWTRNEAYTTADGTEVANLIGIVRGLPKFFEHDLTPYFVFDGLVADLKEDEVAARREAKEEAAEAAAAARAAGDTIEAARYESRTQRLTPVIQETTRELFDLLDVSYLEAPAEGEAQAAYMANAGDVDAVGTEDYDALLFGAPVTIRQLTSSGEPERMSLAETLGAHDITRTQLVDIAILCGTDFNPGLSGYGPKTALQAVQEHGDIYGVLATEDRDIEYLEEVRTLFLEPDVTDEYDVQADSEPDLEGAWHYLTEEWDIPAGEIDSGFERLEETLSQPGLDRWT